MEDERIRKLLTRVINFIHEEPRPSALRVEHEERRAKLWELHNASADEVEKAKLLEEYRVPVPESVRKERWENRKPLREFSSELRRDFPEWHYATGPRREQFVEHIESGSNAIQPDLRKIWTLASERNTEKAKRTLRGMTDRFARNAERLLATTYWSWNPETREKELASCEARPEEARTHKRMVETLEWLERRLRSLKVCENRKCTSGRKYFFKVYPNDRYCSDRCTAKAKALRQAERDAASQKPRKVPTKSPLTLEKMSAGQRKRWDRHRAETGKLK
jgi:hypothetical protein